jgi:hypothetical protein
LLDDVAMALAEYREKSIKSGIPLVTGTSGVRKLVLG